MTKLDALRPIDTPYLRNLCDNLNGQRRDCSSHSRNQLLERVANKLTVDEVKTVIESFDRGESPMSLLINVTPPSARDIRKSVEDYFGARGLYEVKIGPQ